MSIFGTMLSKIFHHGQAKPASTPAAPTPTAAPATPVAPATPAAPTPISNVDVEAVLTEMASHYSHPVNWRSSIVDLMSMLGIDNSLSERRALAKELGYTGSTDDTATMNVWLHKQVMRKLAENGGKVPADLTD